MLDSVLAELYGVEVKRLNEAVKRNSERFPPDFMFQLTEGEWTNLRSQIATTNRVISKVRYFPYAFTEHGVLMLSNVINSERAIDMSIQIIKVFNELRKCALKQSTNSIQIDDLRKLLMLHIENSESKFTKYGEKIKEIVITLNNLMEQPKEKRKIGFKPPV